MGTQTRVGRARKIVLDHRPFDPVSLKTYGAHQGEIVIRRSGASRGFFLVLNVEFDFSFFFFVFRECAEAYGHIAHQRWRGAR